MSSDDRRRGLGRDFLLAALLVMAGFGLSGISLIEIAKNDVRLAQATQPVQQSPAAAPDSGPAESKPGGERQPMRRAVRQVKLAIGVQILVLGVSQTLTGRVPHASKLTTGTRLGFEPVNPHEVIEFLFTHS